MIDPALFCGARRSKTGHVDRQMTLTFTGLNYPKAERQTFAHDAAKVSKEP